MRKLLAALCLAALVPFGAQAATTWVSPVQTITCTNQAVTALAATGVHTCSTITAAMFGSAITAGTVFGNPSGSASTPSFTAAPVLGASGTTGSLGFSGTTSGTVTIKPQAAAGTWEFDLPITAGGAGQALTSQGGAGTAMTWTTVLAAKMTVLSKTTAYTVVSGDDWKRLDDTGAGGAVTFTIDASGNLAAGDNWCFTQVTANAMVIQMGTGEVLHVGTTAGTSAGTLTSQGQFSTVCIYAQSTTSFYAYSMGGGWSLS
jgi:hypothetical protein